MSDERTGRELEPRPEERQVTPVRREPLTTDIERFDAGTQAHTVGLTEERSAQIVRQSGNARSMAILGALFMAFFIPIYWFYDIGIPALGVEGRLEVEADVQHVTDVERGYALYLANCARCHGNNGEGGVGPPLNDDLKLYNALTPDGNPGQGHLNPNYLQRVLEVGGRYVCGDPNSVMPAWLQPAGPLNYREVEEIIAFLVASDEIAFEYDPAAHGEAAEAEETPYEVQGWRDPDYTPAPGTTPPPACWRNPDGVIGGGGGGDGGSGLAGDVETPGTADAPRALPVVETAQITIEDPDGAQVDEITVVPGEVVVFEVTNEAGFAHNFFVGPAEDLEADATGGLPGVGSFDSGTQTFEWTVPDEPVDGLEFACTIPGHYQTMHGTFTFQEASE